MVELNTPEWSAVGLHAYKIYAYNVINQSQDGYMIHVYLTNHERYGIRYAIMPDLSIIYSTGYFSTKIGEFTNLKECGKHILEHINENTK